MKYPDVPRATCFVRYDATQVCLQRSGKKLETRGKAPIQRSISVIVSFLFILQLSSFFFVFFCSTRKRNSSTRTALWPFLPWSGLASKVKYVLLFSLILPVGQIYVLLFPSFLPVGRDAKDVALEEENGGEQMASKGYGATFRCMVSTRGAFCYCCC